jgi:hypothetical protein
MLCDASLGQIEINMVPAMNAHVRRLKAFTGMDENDPTLNVQTTAMTYNVARLELRLDDRHVR